MLKLDNVILHFSQGVRCNNNVKISKIISRLISFICLWIQILIKYFDKNTNISLHKIWPFNTRLLINSSYCDLKILNIFWHIFFIIVWSFLYLIKHYRIVNYNVLLQIVFIVTDNWKFKLRSFCSKENSVKY